LAYLEEISAFAQDGMSADGSLLMNKKHPDIHQGCQPDGLATHASSLTKKIPDQMTGDGGWFKQPEAALRDLPAGRW